MQIRADSLVGWGAVGCIKRDQRHQYLRKEEDILGKI
jgi:hypothetical protein